MNTYRVSVVTADYVRELKKDEFSGISRHCAPWHHDPRVLCHVERLELFKHAKPGDVHELQAWDDGEAMRLAACLVTAEYGDEALANVEEDAAFVASPVGVLFGAEQLEQDDKIPWR